MDNMIFNTKPEIIKSVENNSSYRFKEEKNNTLIFEDKRGDKRVIEYEMVGDKIKVNKDEKILKPLASAKL